MGLFASLSVKAAIVMFILATTVHIVQHGFRFDIWQFFTGPGRISRMALLLVVVANYKALPLMWHARLFGGVFQFYFSPSLGSTPSSAHTVFQPVITSSHSPLAECDINGHKSNATFFSDLDIARANLLACLLSTGVRKLRQKDRGGLISATPGAVNICLGSAQCTFKREIRPYEPYTMRSRILTWDQKWIYVVTHFEAKGKVLAWAISKQVIKVGRLSVDPDVVLRASGFDLTSRAVQTARKTGLVYAGHFAALDDLDTAFL